MKRYLVFLFFSIIIFYFIFSDIGSNYNFYLLFINFVIAEISLYNIFLSSKKPYSLDIMVHLYFVFFIGIAPSVQFKMDTVFWGNSMNLTFEDYLVSNFIFLFSLLIYIISYNYFYKNEITKLKRNKKDISYKVTSKRLFSYILILISVISTIIYAYSNNFNIISILFRGGFIEIDGPKNIQSSAVFQIINIFIRPLPIVCLLFYLFLVKKKNFFLQFFLISIVLFSNAPIGMPRFQAAAFYIPILLIYFRSYIKGTNYSLSIVFGLLFLFPILNQFRYLSDSYDLEFKLDTEMFEKGDFDSYQNSLAVFKANEITYGRQLLGASLFFVPRLMWQNKPVGSGAYIAEKNNYEWTNIGLSYFAEGFINFGYLGVVLFSLVLSFLCAKLDVQYWFFPRGNSVFFIVFYLLFLGIIFFILRGDLLNTTAYAVGVYLCVKFLYSLLKFTKVI